MGIFGRRRAATTTSPSRAQRREEADAVRQHLDDFVRTRVGVEAYLEPPTSVTPPTVVLIATTGEWTRRRIPDEGTIRHLAEDLAVPVYDARITGYPQRMRDWTSKVRREGQSPAT